MDPDPTAPPVATRGRARSGIVLTAVCIGFFMVLFDATAVTVATGDVITELRVPVTAAQWVVNAYTVVFAALMLTAGVLADRWGARRMYAAGAAVFAVASAACALAPTVELLVAARALQGVGAAAVVPCSLALIAHRYPVGPARVRALGVWGGVSGVGLTVGPVGGGVLVTAFGWRAVFLVVVPFALVSAVVVGLRADETARNPGKRLDVGGQLLVAAALVALTAGLTRGPELARGEPVAVGLVLVAAVAAVAFVLVERRVSDPMLPMAVFGNRTFLRAVTIGLLFNLGLYGVLFSLTLVLEQARHASATAAGLVALPLTTVATIGALLSGRVTARFGPRVPLVTGFASALVGAGLLAAVGDRLGPVGVAGLGAVLGVVGLAMPVMTGVAMDAAGPGRAGLGSAVLNTARQTGGALGVAVLGSVALGAASPAAVGDAATPGLRWPLAIAAGVYATAVVLAVGLTGRPRH